MVANFVITLAMSAGRGAGMGLPGAYCAWGLMGLSHIFAGAMIIVGFGISGIVGLVARVYPAYKAESCGGVEA